MTTEEKAKAYDDALSVAKEIHSYSSDIAEIKRMEQIFPELKESEDERIRTELINGFNECLKNSQYPKNAQKYWHNIKIEDILAWLEKQDEKQKWSEEDESKVKEIVYFLDTAKVHYASTTALDDCIEWLKSLKQKIL